MDYNRLYQILTEANARFNLTAITDYDDFLLKHVEDSKLGLPYVDGRVLDIGSGAGFPALVLKSEKPQIDLTMIDSVGKKVKYLEEVIEAFGLKNARAIHARIEDFAEKEAFDTVTARAVAKLSVLAEYALPFLKTGGLFVAYKASDCDGEIKEAANALRILGGKVEKVVDCRLSDEIGRKIVLIRKTARTPQKYPRGGNKPRLSPL